MKIKHYLYLFILTISSEVKAIFYFSDLKVKSALFFGDYRYLCNVIEDYSNILIIGTLLYIIAFRKSDKYMVLVSIFLFILNAFDLIHLGLYDL